MTTRNQALYDLIGQNPTAEAIEAAGESLALAQHTLYGLDGTSVEEAARLAWTPTGPPIDVLIDRIRERRKQVAAA